MINKSDIVQIFSEMELLPQEALYLDSQAERIAYTINVIKNFCNTVSVMNILDVGPHFLTRCIKEFITNVKISTLGYSYEKFMPSSFVNEHITFNLNDCDQSNHVKFQQPFDLIVFSEIIEHLTTSPTIIFQFLKKFIRPGGGLLIQTPNATALWKRILLLRGCCPYEQIREDKSNPGHFREYTLAEIMQFGISCGFTPLHFEYCNYWPSKEWYYRLLEKHYPSLRGGITVLFTT